MKKSVLVLISGLIIMTAVSCRELSRTNPYDPAAENYQGVTYYGEVLYPANLTVKKVLYTQDGLVFAAKKGSVSGIVKGVNGSAQGSFDDIYDICADAAGNIYAVHNESSVKVLDTAGFFTQFSVNADPDGKMMNIESIGADIFISCENESSIEKYSQAGTPQGSLNVTATAKGYFTPGRLFTNGDFLYIVNKLDQRQVLRLNSDLGSEMLIELEFEVKDGKKRQGKMQLLSGTSIRITDFMLNAEKTWGNFGEGPGRILNGFFMAVDESALPGVDAHTYVFDSGTIKKFGD